MVPNVFDAKVAYDVVEALGDLEGQLQRRSGRRPLTVSCSVVVVELQDHHAIADRL